MNFKNVYRSLVIASRFTRADFNEIRWEATRKCHSNSSSTLAPQDGRFSYVQRMKLLQNLREKTGITEEAIKNGKCLIYHKGDPLLNEEFGVAWLNSSDLPIESKLFIDNSVLLGMTEDGRYEFSVQIASFGDEMKKSVLEKTNGTFTDFRLSLMVYANSLTYLHYFL